MQLLYSTPTFRLLLHPTQEALETTFLGFMSGQELRTAYETALSAAVRYRVRCWLSDHHQMRAVRQADQDWLVQDYSPRFVALLTGLLRRSAIVASVDPMNQLFTRDAIDRTVSHGRPWEFDVFDAREEAWEWLTMPWSEPGL